MIERFLDFLKARASEISDIPPEEWDKISKIFKKMDIKKGDYFSKKGQKRSDFGFILSGAFKVSYPQENDKERIKSFLFENDFVGSYASIIAHEVLKHDTQAIADSTILVADYQVFEPFYKRHACWQEIGRKIAENEALNEERRVYELLNLDASARLLELKKNIPKVGSKNS
jgi:CRP-like cAMP-binding protein